MNLTSSVFTMYFMLPKIYMCMIMYVEAQYSKVLQNIEIPLHAILPALLKVLKCCTYIKLDTKAEAV